MSDCGSCSACCYLLEVEDFDKDWLTWCQHANRKCGGCRIYDTRPQACRDFKCLWLASQERAEPGERMADELRPDRSHVMFGPQSLVNRRHLFVHVDPAHRDAWLAPAIQERIAAILSRGGQITVVIGKERVLLAPGMRPVFTTEEQMFPQGVPRVPQLSAPGHAA